MTLQGVEQLAQLFLVGPTVEIDVDLFYQARPSFRMQFEQMPFVSSSAGLK